jgi:hypothetical protein
MSAAREKHRGVHPRFFFNDPYDVEKAFRGSSLCPTSEEEWLHLGAGLDREFEEMEVYLCQVEE